MHYDRLALIIVIPSLMTGYFIHRFINTRNKIWIALSILVMAVGICYLVLVLFLIWYETDERQFRRRKTWLHHTGYSNYVYKRLDKSDPKSIRLIELVPWTRNDLENGIFVRIKMHTVSLEGLNAPEYEAISYCWGDATHLEPLVCDDSVIEVTNSLYCVLQRLHLNDRGRLLWADALCINQTDTEEKNWQVRLMGEVYRHATGVLVYLGEEGLDSELLEDFVPKLARAKKLIATELHRGDISKSKPLSLKRQEELSIPFMRNHKRFIALQFLLLRTWFDRVWIIQEIALAKDAIVICGDWGISWGELVSAFEVTDVLTMSGQNVFGSVFHRLNRLERSRTHRTDFSLEQLLELHRGAGVTDPRDQIYGLLGLAKDGQIFDVDYGRSVAEVYVDAAKKILLSSSRLKILHRVVTPQGDKDPSLPSWVPDWRVDLLQEPLADTNISFKKVHINFSQDGRKLIVRGIPIDMIEIIGVCFRNTSSNEYNPWSIVLMLSTVNKWLHTFWPYFLRPYPTGHILCSVAFWNLILHSSYHIGQRQLVYLRAMIRVSGWISSLPIALHNMKRQYFAVSFVYLPLAASLGYIAQALTGRNVFPVRLNRDLAGRRMMKTGKGYLGLCPVGTKVGDQVFLIDGCQTPMILRRTNADEVDYELIGECSMYKYDAELADHDAGYQSLALI